MDSQGYNTSFYFISSNLETKKYLEELSARNIFFNGNIKLIEKIEIHKIENQNEKILLKKRLILLHI